MCAAPDGVHRRGLTPRNSAGTRLADFAAARFEVVEGQGLPGQHRLVRAHQLIIYGHICPVHTNIISAARMNCKQLHKASLAQRPCLGGKQATGRGKNLADCLLCQAWKLRQLRLTLHARPGPWTARTHSGAVRALQCD